MHAVSRGAAYYGMARQRPRRAHPRRRAAHVLRRDRKRHAGGARLAGSAEGADGAAVRHGGRHRTPAFPNREFGLMVGEPAEFRFFSSASARTTTPGDLIEDFGDDLEELSPMEVTLRTGRHRARWCRCRSKPW